MGGKLLLCVVNSKIRCGSGGDARKKSRELSIVNGIKELENYLDSYNILFQGSEIKVQKPQKLHCYYLKKDFMKMFDTYLNSLLVKQSATNRHRT